ncbi:CpaD family pilus assembly protein [Polycladidibacter hongkongensis]|uniref:CpaD family pilus assembly protein n=1 Tax=Polycladidibacter hongkongensis TaxID=1647556 RepID=UPI001AD92921|nr:CpaD family pilus assembly protein [Pseudovibrio hongkongensis]
MSNSISRSMVCLIVLLGLAACNNTSSKSFVTTADFNPKEKHPIVIAEAAENFDIPLSSSLRTIDKRLGMAIMAFGQQAVSEGNGFVEVLTPAGAANHSAVRAVTPQIKAALKSGGVQSGRIVTRTYPVTDPAASAPIRLAFAKVKATVHECGQWPENIRSNTQNTNFENFGCSTQANLAAMVDNPADLLRPRAMTPSDATRRNVVMGRHRAGEATNSAYSLKDSSTGAGL